MKGLLCKIEISNSSTKQKNEKKKKSKNCFKFQNTTVNSHERSRWLLSQEPHKTKEK